MRTALPTAEPLLLSLPAVLMQAQAQAVARRLVSTLQAQLKRGGEAVLDASALSRFDSSALAVLLACHRAALAKGGSVQISGLPERAQTLAQVYGLGDLLH